MSAALDESSELDALRRRLDEEDAAYAEALAAVDRLAAFPLPLESRPELVELRRRLNELAQPPSPPQAGGLRGRFQREAWLALEPALAREDQFRSTLVQAANAEAEEAARLHASLREVIGALVRYLQRVLPVMDARDRVASAVATTRAELVLESFDRRLESLALRLEGLLALRDRLEAVSESLRAVEAGLAAKAPPPAVAAAAASAARDSSYAAFENRFRGSREEIRERLASYVPLFAGLAPVADLGCGRGEFLELLREAGVEAVGVESNARVVQECRARGLEVVAGDLVAFLRGRAAASLGGVFAGQVAEHLPPAVLQAALGEAHRALRPGGLLLLETVNPRSVVGLLEVFNRDLTHERPLHPETLRFLAAAAGFGEVRIEYRTPVEASARLRPVPADGLPERAAAVLNENVARLNELLYGPLEYALLARR
jgi:O-antigen chain-terminating methyltransferase